MSKTDGTGPGQSYGLQGLGGKRAISGKDILPPSGETVPAERTADGGNDRPQFSGGNVDQKNEAKS